MSGLQMEPVIGKGGGQESANTKAKYSGTFYWNRMLHIAFQVEVAAILDCVTGCLQKRLVKQQATICTDSPVAVAALGASRTKSLLVEDCKKKTDGTIGSKPGNHNMGTWV